MACARALRCFLARSSVSPTTWSQCSAAFGPLLRISKNGRFPLRLRLKAKFLAKALLQQKSVDSTGYFDQIDCRRRVEELHLPEVVELISLFRSGLLLSLL